ncbi:MAG: hypothetical protein IT300_12490 [Dehalococcoidia bacterium]|nr:hypothetical protein [Dehalococcoidia bacterium]
MNAAARLSAGFARTWTRAYTLGLDAGAKTDRRAEIESDLWEHGTSLHWSGRAALEMALRCLLGIPADAAWRAEQARTGERAAAIIATLLHRAERITEWVARRGLPGMTTVLAWAFIAGGLLLTLLFPFQPEKGAGMVVVGGWGIGAGLAIRWGKTRIPNRPVSGFLALAAGAAPLSLILLATVIAPLAALAVLTFEGRRAWAAWRLPKEALRMSDSQ